MNEAWVQRDRLRVADEAARLMLEEGIRDYHHAKRKAAGHLGFGRSRLPTNLEVRDAIHRYRAAFFTAEDFAHEVLLWRTALVAMQLLEDFEPRLTGPVLEGTAGRHSPVVLHVFSDTTEAVLWRLMDQGVRYQELERHLRVRGETRPVPGVRFFGGDVEVEVIVFPGVGLREAPPSQVDGRPMRRAALGEVRERLQALEAGLVNPPDDRGG